MKFIWLLIACQAVAAITGSFLTGMLKPGPVHIILEGGKGGIAYIMLYLAGVVFRCFGIDPYSFKEACKYKMPLINLICQGTA